MGLKDKIRQSIRPSRKVEVLHVSNDALMAGKTVLVTGGTSGIGRATVELLVRCGATVAFTGRPDNPSIAEVQKRHGKKVRGFEYDALKQSATSLFERVRAELGTLPDCLLANAGIYADGDGVWETESVERILRINLLATTELLNVYIAGLIAEGRGGTIVVTGSNRGLMPDDVPYGLSKAAVHSFVRGIAREHYENGIRANVVAPGMTASNINGMDPDGELAMGLKTIGDARVIRPEEIAEVILFLLSDRSLCINGAIIPCDLGDSLR